MILRARGVSLKEASTRRHQCAGVGMIGGWEIDARHRGGRFWMVGLLMDRGLFFSLFPIVPLSIELDGLVLPNLERGGDGVHRVDSLFDSLDKTFLEHFMKSDIVVATESLILLEVLNILFGGVSGHGDVLEFGSSGGARV